MKSTVSEKSLAVIKSMQQNELTESVIYAKIASFAKGEENKKTLLRLHHTASSGYWHGSEVPETTAGSLS